MGSLQPDITFLLDAPAHVGIERLKNRRGRDRIESERLEFFERVRLGYLTLAAQAPERFRIINADRPLPDVQQQLLSELNNNNNMINTLYPWAVYWQKANGSSYCRSIGKSG